MENRYKALNRYRLKKHMNMVKFAQWIGLDHMTVRRTLTGISEPHDYNKVIFDDFYLEHEENILSTILDAEPINA